MAFRDRLLSALSRGNPPERDPSELVEIAVVPLVEAPRLVAALREAGFHATLFEAFNLATQVASDAWIMAPRGEAEAAIRLLDARRSS